MCPVLKTAVLSHLLHRGHTLLGPQQINISFRSSSNNYWSQHIDSLKASSVPRKKDHTKRNRMKGREEIHVTIFSCIFIDKLNTLVNYMML